VTRVTDTASHPCFVFLMTGMHTAHIEMGDSTNISRIPRHKIHKYVLIPAERGLILMILVAKEWKCLTMRNNGEKCEFLFFIS
jgi:hypothetical protein